jgi:4-aminobutyrate aminotransferase-like enzyme
MPPDAESQYPAGHVFYRRLKRRYPRIVRGEGCWLYDADGKRYLDASSGALVSNLGHGNAELARALGEQAARLGYVSGMTFTHDPIEELAAELAGLSAPGLDKSLFMCNGGDAVEAALKISRQFWAESGRPEKHRIVALAPSYHGNTLLAMSASARPSYRELFRDWLVEVETAPAPYAYQCRCRGDAEDCPTCDGSAVEAAILRVGPENVAAFIAEPVGGVSTGASVPRPGYWKKIREICDRHEVHFVADEVLVGAGRTGTWSALEPYGVAPDFQIFGKGIAGGYAPLSALVTLRRRRGGPSAAEDRGVDRALRAHGGRPPAASRRAAGSSERGRRSRSRAADRHRVRSGQELAQTLRPASANGGGIDGGGAGGGIGGVPQCRTGGRDEWRLGPDRTPFHHHRGRDFRAGAPVPDRSRRGDRDDWRPERPLGQREEARWRRTHRIR